MNKKPRPTMKDIEVAASNGINGDTLRSRLGLNWSMERATTEKVQVKDRAFTDDEIKLMREHNVPSSVAYARIKTLEWDRHEAMTKELQKRGFKREGNRND